MHDCSIMINRHMRQNDIKKTAMDNRSKALDALRGLAIIGMILSGTITQSLPGWMYHAQVGPRSDFHFDPSVYGITWVDLVFPFFLFAMGAAIPVAMSGKLKEGKRMSEFLPAILKRSLMLVIFAVSIYYCSPYRLTGGSLKYLLAMLAFLFWFMAFVRIGTISTRKNMSLNLAGLALLALLVFINIKLYPDVFTSGFKLSNNDIIILVLANMALFGAVIWLLTVKNLLLRLGILAVYFAIRLTSGAEGSWNQALFSFNPLNLLPDNVVSVLYNPGAYLFRMDFLKYLFIVVPGTIVGDLIVRHMNDPERDSYSPSEGRGSMYMAALLMFSAVLANLILLYNRNLHILPVVNISVVFAGYFLLRNPQTSPVRFYYAALQWGAFWLILGTFFEAFEGGIRKDHATMSYFFVTTALAIFMLIFFSVVIDYFKKREVFRYIVECGQNPMVAYVAGNFVAVPLLSLAGLMPFLSSIDTITPWFGIVKGLFITGIMMAVTIITVRRRWFWKT